MLPMHPQPLQDEVLSSWMVRLAFANQFPLHTFYAALLNYRSPIWTRDIDRHPSLALLKTLSLHTHQSLTVLQSKTLRAYEGLLFPKLPMNGDAPWILPLGVFHRSRKRAGMLFCPLCLQQDSVPYYRRYWRLAFYAICSKHNCVMEECCPICHSPIMFHRHGVGRGKVPSIDHLRLCHACRFDLGSTKPFYVEWPDESSWSQFRWIVGGFEEGCWGSELLAPPCGIQYFQGLRVLVGVLGGRSGPRFHEVFKRQLGLELPEPRGLDFEYLEIKQRLKFLLAAIWLLEDWPDRFVSSCAEAHFTRCRIAEDLDVLPYWLASVANEFLDTRVYMPNSVEISWAVSYLLSQEKMVTRQALGDVLGVSRDRATAVWNVWKRTIRD